MASLVVATVNQLLGELKIQTDDPLAVVSRVHLECLTRAAHQQATGDHQRERDGDLRGNEALAESAAHRATHLFPGSIENGSERKLASAGTSPNSTPASTDMTRTYARIVKSGFTSRTSVKADGSSSAALVTARCNIAHVSGSASDPASTPRRPLSVTSCRISAIGGAERETHAEFVLTGSRTRQLQTGGVGAGDDQHHPGRSHDQDDGQPQAGVDPRQGRARRDHRGHVLPQVRSRASCNARSREASTVISACASAHADARRQAAEHATTQLLAVTQPTALWMHELDRG